VRSIEGFFDGRGHGAHEHHQPDIAGLVEVAHGVFDVLFGGDQDLARQGGPAIEEGDVRVVLEDFSRLAAARPGNGDHPYG
jgi:hypothetical protein